MAKLKRIFFEDHGQDFLYWDIDQDGSVVDCGPFQYSVWVGTKVFRTDEPDSLATGKQILFQSKSMDSPRILIYPIEKIEELEEEVVNG